MLHRRLRIFLYISYFHLLLFGLLPTTFQINKNDVSMGKLSIGYLIYSVCPVVVLLLEAPYMMASGILGGNLRHNVVILWSIMASLIIRFAAVLSCYGLVWLLRQRLLRLYVDFLTAWKTHWCILVHLVGEDCLQRLQKELTWKVWRVLIVNYGMIFFSLLMQFRLYTETNGWSAILRICSILLFSIGRICFITLLLLLNHQFSAVQLALRKIGLKSQVDLRCIAGIHAEWLLLARRAFSFFDVANASIFVNMFVESVTIFYHAVQFGNKTIKSDYWGLIIGDFLIVFNILNSFLLMNMLDTTLSSCNDSGKLLRRFNDLRRLRVETEMELELFASTLRNNRLIYRIFGVVVLDKAAYINYMASVFGHVIVLMQFDLKRMREKGLRYDNFLENLKDQK